MLASLYRAAVIHLAKPYIRRELPGWGYLYRNLVGSYEKDGLWRDEPERWVRGKLHGYQMSVRIGGWSNRHTFFLERFYDLPTQLLLKQALREGDTFVDVGANEGMMTLLGSRLVGDKGRVISFEPNPGPRSILARNLARNGIGNVELHGAGLGDAPGELRLFVPAYNSGEGSFTVPTDDSTGDYVTCPMLVGDELIAERSPKLVKIDVEGFEAHVLRGLAGTIERDKPLICMEIIAGHLARDGQSPQAIRDWLAERGYSAAKLELKGRDCLTLGPGLAGDGDYVFIHPDRPL